MLRRVLFLLVLACSGCATPPAEVQALRDTVVSLERRVRHLEDEMTEVRREEFGCLRGR